MTRGRWAALAAAGIWSATLLLVGGSASAARPAVASGTDPWSAAFEVPGLNAFRGAEVDSVSCPAAGDCVAAGGYDDRSGRDHAFVASQVHGTWRKARAIPVPYLPAGLGGEINHVACASAGNCTAAGYYRDNTGHQLVFTVDEVAGRWGAAREIPGTAALNKGGFAVVQSLSCPSRGNCAAAGFYADSANRQQAFVASEVRGKWDSAREIPGSAALHVRGFIHVAAVSCGSAGDCVVGGTYTDAKGQNSEAFIASESRGSWSDAREVPGTAALNVGERADLESLSCASPGNCVAGGSYVDGQGRGQAFLVTQSKGSWAPAREVPGLAALNRGGAYVNSVSCPSPGSCAAGGSYSDQGTRAFVITESHGVWATARPVPVYRSSFALISFVSCATAGNCSAAGPYDDHAGQGQLFIADEVAGRWGVARQVPGTASLHKGGFIEFFGLSCSRAGNCAAGGLYTGSAGRGRAFIVTKR